MSLLLLLQPKTTSSPTTSSFRYYPRVGFTTRVTGAIVQGSNNGTTWVDLATITVEPPDSAWSVINFATNITTTYSYLRYLSSSAGFGNIAEIEFYSGTYGSGGVKVGAVNVIASVTGGTNPPENAFDGNTISFFEGNVASGQYVGINQNGVPAGSFIHYYPRASLESRSVGAKFQGSNNYTMGTLTSGTWTDLYTITTTPAAGFNNYLPSSPFSSYRYLRYYGGTGDFGNVAELQFWNGSTRIVPTVTYGTAGTFGGGNTYDKALDGDVTTYFDSVQSDNNIIGIDTVANTTFTKTQPATARLVANLTRTQPATSRISQTRTLTQPSIARVAKNLILTQPATARIVNTGVVKTQPSIARIATNRTFSQGATARVAKSIPLTQPGIARLARTLTRTQPGIARVVQTVSRNQPATARIVATLSRTQPGISRISQTYIKTQTGIARVATNRTLAQPATARISSTSIVKTQPATARIVATRTFTQGAISRVATNRSLAQPATARIATNRTLTQPGISRLANTRIKIQTGIARVALNFTKTQPSLARIATLLTRTQLGISRISQTGTKTQSATANITQVGATASFRYYPRPGFTSRVTGAKIQGSNDMTTWTDFATISTQPTDSVYSVVNFNVDLKNYGYLRYLSPVAGYGDITEIEFYDGTYGSGGVKIAPTTIIASFFGGGQPPSYAFDVNTTTFYEGNAADNQYVGIDRRPVINSFRYYPRAGQEGRMLGGIFQGSNDYISGTLTSGTWTNLYTIPSTPTAGWNVASIADSISAYRYLRYVAPVSGYGNVAELEWYIGGVYGAGGTKVVPAATFGTAGSFSGTSSDTYDKALDANTGTFFDSTQADGAIIGIDRGSPSLTKTQPAVARIIANRIFTQGVISRISNTRFATQPAIARVAQTNSKFQLSLARIAISRTLTQPATAKIATSVSKTQPGISRIAITRTATQPAVARIARQLSLNQPATARIVNALSSAKTQPAISRIATSRLFTQGARARVALTTAKNQPATAKIVQSIIGSKTQPGISRISQTYNKLQSAISRIAQRFSKTQSATARLLQNVILTKTQTATARIAINATIRRTTVITVVAPANVSLIVTKAATSTITASKPTITTLVLTKPVTTILVVTKPASTVITLAKPATTTITVNANSTSIGNNV